MKEARVRAGQVGLSVVDGLVRHGFQVDDVFDRPGWQRAAQAFDLVLVTLLAV